MSIESCSPLGSDLSSLELSCSALSGDEHSSAESLDTETLSPQNSTASPLMDEDRVPCQICRLQRSAVIYFSVPVCSGCRAFFMVPNRRVCKYCRFDRCVKAGMLDAKLRLQNRLSDLGRQSHPESLSTASTSIDILTEMGNLKSRIRQKRTQLYGPMMGKESPSGLHDMDILMNEYVLFNREVATTPNLFSPLESTDWNTLSMFEFSMWWSLLEQTQWTSRNYGHEAGRQYQLDNSFTSLDETRQHWQCLKGMVADETVFDALVDYFHGVQTTMTNSVGRSLAKAQLDETEMSALLLFLYTRPACMEIVHDEKSKQYLRWLRNQTLVSLAEHLRKGGRNVEERMGQIIFLTSDFQNLGRLVKHSIRLLMTATQYRAAPKEFTSFFEQQLHLYEKYAVF